MHEKGEISLHTRDNKYEKYENWRVFFRKANSEGIYKSSFLEKLWFERYIDYEMNDFVIPNETRWDCIKCGQCCQCLMNQMNPINEEPHQCEELVNGNICRIHENNERPPECIAFPFTLHTGIKRDFLFINNVCNGYGKGEIISVERYKTIANKDSLKNLKTSIYLKFLPLSYEDQYIFGTPENIKNIADLHSKDVDTTLQQVLHS